VLAGRAARERQGCRAEEFSGCRQLLLQTACRTLAGWDAGRMKVSLRTALVAMLLTATVPIAVLMCYHLLDKMRSEQARMRSGLDREAMVLAQAVENELVATIEALRILGVSEALRTGDVREFERSVAGRGPLRSGWQGSFLTDTRGVVIFDTTGASQRGAISPVPGLRQMLWDRTPMVSGLLRQQPRGQPSTVVAVPVIIDGELRFGLGVWVPWAAWQVLLKRSTPSEGFSTLFDRTEHVIARSVDPEHHVGLPLPHTPPANEASYDSVMAVSIAGWGVRRGIAAAPVVSAQIRSMAVAWLTAAACLLLGVSLALLVARRITRPLGVLARNGSPALLGAVHVREIAALRDALQAARERDQAAHDGLRRKADEFETLFNSSPIGLAFAQDRDCKGVLRNAAMGHLFGAGTQAPPQVYHQGEPLAPEQMPLCVAARTGQAVAMMELEFRSPEQPPVHAIANAVPLRDANGRPRGAISALVDITARKQMEAQLHETHAQLKTADRAKDEFLAMLGHELRNPLSAIASAVEVLKRHPSQGDEMSAAARDVIARQTLHLSHMMGDLLDVTRLTSGKVMLARQPLDLARLVQHTLDTLALRGETAQHPVDVDLQEGWVDGDATRLEQVVTNLVGNALKYTPAGRAVSVVTRVEAGEVVLRVADTGDGIPPELLPRVFDLFVQGERSLDRRAGGLGIGLTLVKRMVDLHGGSVTASSSASGTRFEVKLPQVPAAPAPAHERAADSRPALRVLVVEDNPDALQSMRDVLALDGHVVAGERNGREGLATLLAQWPEVAIVDIGLPGLDGFQVALRARSQGYAGRMIAVSGYGQKEDAQRALKSGFDAHVVKPVDMQQLRRLMREEAPAHA
jgi:signal transduction histidine kinase/ActR/RegA family two-component response regulator